MRALAVALCLLAAPSAAAAQPEVLMIGSSSVAGPLGRTIEAELEGWGMSVRRRGRGASGFARPDFYDWEAHIGDLAPLDRYAAVLVLTGGNDVQSLRADDGGWVRWQDEAEWSRVYVDRVRRFVDTMCDEGARRVVVLLPANGGRPRWSERIVRVRAGLAAGAEASRCGVAMDGGDDELPSHDGVHLTRRGAVTLWSRIAAAMSEVLQVRVTARAAGASPPRGRSAPGSAGSAPSPPAAAPRARSAP